MPMSFKRFMSAVAVAGALFCSPTILAKTHYVTDDMMVPMRSGAGNEFRIINSRIRSGTAMQVLAEPPGDWTQVRTSNGTEGWIRKQYLQKTPVAKTQVAEAKKGQAEAEAKLAQVQQQLAAIQAEHAALQKLSGSTQQAHANLNAEYQSLKILSEDAVNLSQRYQDLLAKHEVLMTQHDALNAENDNLRSDNTISNGLYSIALLLAGVVLAVLLPMFRPRRRYSDQIL